MSNLRSFEVFRGRGGGYGFTVSGQAPCFISWIGAVSPAEAAGLERYDCIIRVNGTIVTLASHEHVVKLIGMSDDLLSLEIRRSGIEKDSSTDDDDLRTPNFDGLRTKRCVMHNPPHPNQSVSEREDTNDLTRTEHVLNELKNGTLYKSVLSALDSNPNEIGSSTESSRSGQGSRKKPRPKHTSKERSSKVSRVNNTNTLPHPIRTAGTPKKPSHRRILSLPIENSSKANFSGSSSNCVFVQSVVAYLGTVEIAFEFPGDVPHLCFAAIEACVQQLRREQHVHQRVVLKIMQNAVKLFNADGDVIAVYDGGQICFSSLCPGDIRFFCIATLHGSDEVRCHQFMVDPDICAHTDHIEKAKRFGIHCSTDTETGNCIEFPKSPQIILKMVEALFDPHQIESTPVSTGTVQGPMKHEIGTSQSITGSNFDGMNGSAVQMQNHIQQYIITKPNKKETAGSRLSQNNLKRHDLNGMESMTQTASLNRRHTGPGILSTAMLKMPSGKYKDGAGTLPLQRSSASRKATQESRTQEVCVSKRGKKGSKTEEGLFFRVPKRSSSRQLKLNMKYMMSKSSENIPLPEGGLLSGASSIESLNSNASLPSYAIGSGIPNLENGGKVSAWRVSFDKMLEDPMGVKYFTEFLRKEFSQENILFWLECEKLRKVPATDTSALKELADSIFERFLSGVATSPVNIDSKGQRLSEEALTKPPDPNMFEQQQNQIFNLMKLDSYSRFMKSSLYRQCVLCEIEGSPLPLELEAQKDSMNGQIENRPSFSLKYRRFFPRRSRKSQGSNDSIYRDSSDSEPGFVEALSNARPETTAHPVGVDASLICKLILWDDSSTVLYAEEGKATIREALNALCERRGVPLSAVDIYYQNEDRALALDQDVSVLAGQEVRVERRTLFRLDLLPIGRSVGVKAKPIKSTEDVLKPVVLKYGLNLDDLQTRLSGERDLIDLSQPVQVLDGLRVCVDYANLENSQDSSDRGSTKSRTKSDHKSKEKKSKLPDLSDTEDLINIMSAAQGRKLHDQRGLLSEMNFELPDFLKTPTPSPTRHPGPATNNNNNNNKDDSKENLDSLLSSNENGFPLDISLSKGAKLSPNPVGTGNAKARIQKLKHNSDMRPARNTLPIESKTPRSKTLSLDNAVGNNDTCDTDTISAVDNDSFVITKWMQSVSCTPKYPYSHDLDETFGLLTQGKTNLVDEVKDTILNCDDGSPSSHSSVAHDHRYTKRKEKVHDI